MKAANRFPATFRVGALDAGPPAAMMHIVGSNRSMNQSLAAIIEGAVNARCTCEADGPYCAVIGKPSPLTTIFLVDCLELDKDAIENQLRRYAESLTDESKMVLFNVAADVMIDDNAGQRRIWGVFYQSDSKSGFLNGIRAIMEGRRLFSRHFSLCPLAIPPHNDTGQDSISPALSPREKEISQHISCGMSNAAIADELKISLHTVKTHVYNIYKKIGVPNRLQAALWIAAHL